MTKAAMMIIQCHHDNSPILCLLDLTTDPRGAPSLMPVRGYFVVPMLTHRLGARRSVCLLPGLPAASSPHYISSMRPHQPGRAGRGTRTAVREMPARPLSASGRRHRWADHADVGVYSVYRTRSAAATLATVGSARSATALMTVN